MRCLTIRACVGLVCVLGISGIRAQETAPAGSAPAASVPRLIKFSGELRDLAGKPLTGAVDAHFAIYRAQQDAAPIWEETQTLQLDEQGRYSVLLGAMQAEGLPVELFTSGEARWLGMQVGNLPEQPRVLMVSVPYALKAADAETLGGKPASAYALAGQAATTVLAVGRTAKSDAPQRADLTGDLSADGQPKALVTSGQTHFLGTTSDYVLRITQYGTGRGLYGLSQSGEAVYGQILGTSGTTYGVRGMTPSTTGAGVFGQSTATTGPSYGVRGQTSNPVGGGVFGYNQAATGSAFGIIGQTTSTQGNAVYGRALAATGPTFGLSGIADSSSGTGISAQATAVSGTTTGLFAKVNSLMGTALIVDNAGGGKLLSARVSGVEKFSVDGNGKFIGGLGAFSGSSETRIVFVNQTGTGWGLEARGGDVAVFGQAKDKGIYGIGNYGVYGEARSTFGDYGVYGVGPYGVYGQGSFYGVYGQGLYWSGNYGVYGDGKIGVYGNGPDSGVAGHSSNIGVLGLGNETGVYGEGATGVRGWGGYIGVLGIGDAEIYGTTYGVFADGNLAASGWKSAVVALPDDRVVQLYAMESPDNWFEDFGSAALSNGIAEVKLDGTFGLTVNTEMAYHVFLTPNGDCEGLYVASKTTGGFEVRELRGGKSNITFDFRIVARRRGFENVRLQEVDADEETVAALRKHSQATPGRPKLRLPKKPEAPKAPPAPPEVQAAPLSMRAPLVLEPPVPPKGALPR